MLLNQGSIGEVAFYQHLVSGQTWFRSGRPTPDVVSESSSLCRFDIKRKKQRKLATTSQRLWEPRPWRLAWRCHQQRDFLLHQVELIQPEPWIHDYKDLASLGVLVNKYSLLRTFPGIYLLQCFFSLEHDRQNVARIHMLRQILLQQPAQQFLDRFLRHGIRSRRKRNLEFGFPKRKRLDAILYLQPRSFRDILTPEPASITKQQGENRRAIIKGFLRSSTLAAPRLDLPL